MPKAICINASDSVFLVEGNIYDISPSSNGFDDASGLRTKNAVRARGFSPSGYPDSSDYDAARFIVLPFEEGTKVHYIGGGSHDKTVYTLTKAVYENGKVCYCYSWDNLHGTSGNSGGFALPHGAWSIASPIPAPAPTPRKGDIVQVQITATYQGPTYGNDGHTFKTPDSGAFYVANRDIDGKIKVIRQPLSVGQLLTHRGRKYSVLNLLDNNWAVVLREGTKADYKLVHQNDTAWTRVSS